MCKWLITPSLLTCGVIAWYLGEGKLNRREGVAHLFLSWNRGSRGGSVGTSVCMDMCICET